MSAPLSILPSGPQHQQKVTDLLAAAMGRGGDPRFADLLEWKHRANPFGESPAWVAVADGEVVGYRAFMRWEFTDGARTFRAVRAVDTATHPDHQGKGIFKLLTLHALEEVCADGVDFVFNTPNDQSRPGYLKMGWEFVGRLPPRVRPRALSSLPRIVRGRTPAGHWGEPTDAGRRADEVFADDAGAEALVLSTRVRGLQTRRSPAYLRWRYDADLLGYRVLTVGSDLAEGAACFRLRRRGDALEATIGDLLVPGQVPATRRRLIRSVLAATRADYALVLDGAVKDRTVPLPGQGPTLVWRSVNATERPLLEDWHLTMGDIELF